MNNPVIKLENAEVFQGHNLEILKTFADNSVDSIVTDPPYELGFMNKSWDASGIAYNVELWRECLRVLKPGGHLLAFGGSRTWHRLAVAIEDAGFEMRDSIAWLYGSGFPKSHNISKAIDKAAGAERKVVGHRFDGMSETAMKPDKGWNANSMGSVIDITEPATDEAKKWDGWGTALKPAFEPIVVARKPLIGTVAENVLTWGVGGLNIDASRIGTTDNLNGGAYAVQGQIRNDGWGMQRGQSGEYKQPEGRWPANIILDEHTAQLLDEQSGQVKGAVGMKKHTNFTFDVGEHQGQTFTQGKSDIGGASRFFYVAKANKQDRNEGLDNIEGASIGAKGNGLARICEKCGTSILNPCECPDRTYINPVRQNFHPTVKPTTLMSYLIKLVTPVGATVLDPFAGSGSTGKAALLEGYKFIGIELTAEYLPIIEGRLKHAETTCNNKQETLFDD